MYLFLKKYSKMYSEDTVRFIIGTGGSEESFYDVIQRDVDDFNHQYNKEIGFDNVIIQTLESSCGEMLYIKEKPGDKYFVDDNDEEFEYDYVEYFAVPLEENKRIEMPLVFSNNRTKDRVYF